jgi:hypothetical protein
MDALIATSRSIHQDPFIKREQTKNQLIHHQKIQNITGQKFHHIQDEHINILRKSKSAAKIFKM